METVTGYISKHIDDVMPRITVRKFLKVLQKPWINSEVPAALHTRTAAHKGGDFANYKTYKYKLQESHQRDREAVQEPSWLHL